MTAWLQVSGVFPGVQRQMAVIADWESIDGQWMITKFASLSGIDMLNTDGM